MLQEDDRCGKPQADHVRKERAVNQEQRRNKGDCAHQPVNFRKQEALRCHRDEEKVVYIETASSGRHCIIHTVDNSYTTTHTLSEYEGKLSQYGFFRIHKTCLVQLKLIQDIFPWSSNGFALHMQGFPEVLPIGRDRIKLLRQKLEL